MNEIQKRVTSLRVGDTVLTEFGPAEVTADPEQVNPETVMVELDECPSPYHVTERVKVWVTE